MLPGRPRSLFGKVPWSWLSVLDNHLVELALDLPRKVALDPPDIGELDDQVEQVVTALPVGLHGSNTALMGWLPTSARVMPAVMRSQTMSPSILYLIYAG